MSKIILGRKLVILFVVTLWLSTLVILDVEAQPRTIYVPDNYSTIQEAIEASNNGDTIYVKKGHYKGPSLQTITIDKSISLIGEDAKTTTLTLYPNSAGSGGRTFLQYRYHEVIKITANDVKISGFTIQSEIVQQDTSNPAYPILVSGGKNINIYGNRTEITNNVLELSLDVLSGSNHIIDNNSISYMHFRDSNNSICKNNVLGSLRIYNSNSNEISNNVITGYNNGIFVFGNENIVMNNTIVNNNDGIDVSGISSPSSNNIFCYNTIYNNTYGIVVTSKGDKNLFFANYVYNNSFGVAVRRDYPPGETLLFNNNFIDNGVQVNTDSTYVFATGDEVPAFHSGFFDNGTFGNYWSDYRGVDFNGDGIGDSPYVIDGNRTDHYPLMTPYILTDITIPSFPSPTPEPTASPEPEFPTTILGSVIIVIVGLGIFTYYKKYKRRS